MPDATKAPLDAVYPIEAEIANKLLNEFRQNIPNPNIQLSIQRANVLEQRITEALVKAHEAGVADARR